MGRPFLKPKAEREAIVRSVLELAANGTSYMSAARRHGISPYSFYNWAHGLGITIPARPPKYAHLKKGERRIIAEEAVQRCHAGHSLSQVCKHFGTTRDTLMKLVKEFDLFLELHNPGAKGYSIAEKRGRVSAVIRLMEGGAMFIEACGVVKSQPALIHQWATREQRAWIDQFIRDTRGDKKVREEQAYLVAQADELAELFGSSEPLGWEAE